MVARGGAWIGWGHAEWNCTVQKNWTTWQYNANGDVGAYSTAYRDPPPHGIMHHGSPTSPASGQTGPSTIQCCSHSDHQLVFRRHTNSNWTCMLSKDGLLVAVTRSSMALGELLNFNYNRARKMPLPMVDPSMLICFLYESGADWIQWIDRGY